MTDIAQAVVEKMLKAEHLEHTLSEIMDCSDQFAFCLLQSALQAINLPDLLRKEREYDALLARVEAAIPSNWCDPILTGPDAVLSGKGGTWGCPDIERLLSAIRKRLLVEQEG